MYQIKNLQKLALEKCDLALLDYNFLSKLTKLELTKCKVDPNRVKNLPNVTKLKIRLHEIKIFNIFTQNFFSNFRNITKCDLSSIFITKIESNWFEPLINLVKLNLSNNHIKLIEPGSFKALNKLEHLDLSSNHIEIIDSSWFIGIENSLTCLDLTFNLINKFKNKPFSRMIKLQDLEIDLNEFNFPIENHYDLFDGLINLEYVRLHIDEFSDFEADTQAYSSVFLKNVDKFVLFFYELQSFEGYEYSLSSLAINFKLYQ